MIPGSGAWPARARACVTRRPDSAARPRAVGALSLAGWFAAHLSSQVDERQTDRQTKAGRRTHGSLPADASPGASAHGARPRGPEPLVSLPPPTRERAEDAWRNPLPGSPVLSVCLVRNPQRKRKQKLKSPQTPPWKPGRITRLGLRSRQQTRSGSRERWATRRQRPLVSRQLTVPTGHDALLNADVHRILTSPGVEIFPFLEEGNRRKQSQQEP